MPCSVFNTTQEKIDSNKLIYLVDLVMKTGDYTHGEDYLVSLIFIGKKRMRNLNREYRGKDTSTDVLSFTYETESLEGEVYISIDDARAQARAYGHSLSDELAQLTIHGVLHLLGYDHENACEAEVMQSMEEKVWKFFK